METKESIKFKRTKLAEYSLISTPGKYELEASSNVTERNLVTDEADNSRYIASFKAIAKDKFTQLKETFKDIEEVDIEQTNGLFLTANIWNNGSVELPMKGEKVECNIDFVEARDGSSVLRITNIKLRPAKKADKLDLSSFFNDEGAAIDTQVETSKELVHA